MKCLCRPDGMASWTGFSPQAIVLKPWATLKTNGGAMSRMGIC